MKKVTKQARLPGTEDAEIEELHDAAMDYAAIRDKRMALTPQEADLKMRLLKLMHKHKKTSYNHNGVEIEVVSEEETVKVRVKRDKSEDEEK